MPRPDPFCPPDRANRPDCFARGGWTLVELLVVLFVIGILIALILPAIQASRAAARRAHCAVHLRQFGLAIASYHDVHQAYPIGRMKVDDPRLAGPNPPCSAPPLSDKSVHVQLLPYLDQLPTYQAFNFNLSIHGHENRTACAVVVGVFLCPDDPAARGTAELISAPLVPLGLAAAGERIRASRTSYVARAGTLPVISIPDLSRGCRTDPRLIAQVDGTFHDVSPIRQAMITDGLSHTLFVSERSLTHGERRFPSLLSENGASYVGSLSCTLFVTTFPPNAGKNHPFCTSRASRAGTGEASTA
ncbi:MAG: hypothetical protein KatS3mg108_2704 [Isosphaeraceae bacterium]|jgi:prepilin-type N-terminal cleavage/methylation domain-containing protein|nr:MAG: hypothetical protein KatS3mg108_2704 [Isosphaeraceae bacterium]